MLAELRTPDGERLDLTLTTNGSVLARKAQVLKAAGLSRLTVSLDAIDDSVFRAMNDVGFAVEDVLSGIDASLATGFGPVKVNMVVKKGTNDHQILPLTRAMWRRYGNAVVLRFIEYMDVGATNGWRLDEVLPSVEVLARLRTMGTLERLGASARGETAERYRFDGTGQEIGLISSVTHAFCGDCNRARLSTDGRLFLCLFATKGHDFRRALREGANDRYLALIIDGLWGARDHRYSETRSRVAARDSDAGVASAGRVEMHYIGG
jgi:cyclic pyranopterin phosphate synthase